MVRAGFTARRRGVTLIELMVVILIIMIIAGLTIGFLTAFNGTASSAQGANTVQNTLSVARSEALRSRRAYGVRLLVDPTTNLVSQLQYIEQPDDFFGGRVQTVTTSGTPQLDMLLFPDVDLSGGFGSPNQWPVQKGDYVEVKGTGTVRRIINIVGTNQVQLASPLPAAVPSTAVQPTGVKPNQFRIIRAARVTADEPVPLPNDIVIDIGTLNTYNPQTQYPGQLPYDPNTGNIDILFGPSGAVISRGASEKPIYLWVRNVNQTVRQGDDTFIVIYPRTGQNAAHAVSATGDPYAKAWDGRSSGL
jgi:prepilin-type N-terminal cleavage/methylation domain-containing protein